MSSSNSAPELLASSLSDVAFNFSISISTTSFSSSNLGSSSISSSVSSSTNSTSSSTTLSSSSLSLNSSTSSVSVTSTLAPSEPVSISVSLSSSSFVSPTLLPTLPFDIPSSPSRTDEQVASSATPPTLDDSHNPAPVAISTSIPTIAGVQSGAQSTSLALGAYPTANLHLEEPASQNNDDASPEASNSSGSDVDESFPEIPDQRSVAPQSQSAPAMAVGAAPTIDPTPAGDHTGSGAAVATFTTTYQTTMRSASGSMSSGQVVQMTQVTTSIMNGSGPLASPTRPAVAAASSPHHASELAAIIVPILVFVFVLFPCIVVGIRIRRRRQVHFMATYEDLTGTTGQYPYSARRPPYADTLSTIRESGSQYDMCSIPSASMVHTDMLQHRARSGSHARDLRTANPFADPTEEDVQSPLFRSTFSRPYGRNDSRGTASPTSTNSTRSPSRWGALSPTSTSSRSTSRVGTFSPVPGTDSVPGSRGSPRALSLLGRESGRESSDGALSGPEWERMDDPFANPNKRVSSSHVPRAGPSNSLKGHIVYSSLLPKVTKLNRNS